MCYGYRKHVKEKISLEMTTMMLMSSHHYILIALTLLAMCSNVDGMISVSQTRYHNAI